MNRKNKVSARDGMAWVDPWKYPRQSWEKFHALSIFTGVYKSQLID